MPTASVHFTYSIQKVASLLFLNPQAVRQAVAPCARNRASHFFSTTLPGAAHLTGVDFPEAVRVRLANGRSDTSDGVDSTGEPKPAESRKKHRKRRRVSRDDCRVSTNGPTSRMSNSQDTAIIISDEGSSDQDTARSNRSGDGVGRRSEKLGDGSRIDFNSRDLLSLTAYDLSTLKPGAYVNDKVINWFMAQLPRYASARTDGVKAVYAFNSFFYEKLSKWSCGIDGVMRWTKKIDLLKMDRVFFPIHEGLCHWTLVSVDIDERTLTY